MQFNYLNKHSIFISFHCKFFLLKDVIKDAIKDVIYTRFENYLMHVIT